MGAGVRADRPVILVADDEPRVLAELAEALRRRLIATTRWWRTSRGAWP
jgi:hypothetical protein